MSVRIVVAPYDSGHRGARMGAGPAVLLPSMESALRAAGVDVDVAHVDVEAELATEIATSLQVAAHVDHHAFHARRDERVPLVLSGNCSAALGGASGVETRKRYEELAVVWFDAHADLNTADTSTSGFLDGMSLAMLTGRGWRPAIGAAFSSWSGPVPEERVVLVGARDLDPAEEEVLRTSAISLVRGGAGASVPRGLAWPLDQVARECPRVYVHLDCDVLDTSVGRANRFACPGGLSADELATAMRMVRERFVVAGMGVSAYDPAFDTDGGILRAVTGAVRALLA